MSQSQSNTNSRFPLQAHAAAKGDEMHAKYGPGLDWPKLQLALQDRACVRYPTQVVFDAQPLLPGELAHPMPNGERPEEGFRLYVHPALATQPHQAVYAVLYQLVLINYGAFASPEDAEIFGANALGIPQEVYYQALCEMADNVSAGELPRTGRN